MLLQNLMKDRKESTEKMREIGKKFNLKLAIYILQNMVEEEILLKLNDKSSNQQRRRKQ